MKYIHHIQDGFYLFPNCVKHIDMTLLACQPGSRSKIISAGFITDGKCHGGSVSLELQSLPNDTAALMAQMGIEMREK